MMDKQRCTEEAAKSIWNKKPLLCTGDDFTVASCFSRVSWASNQTMSCKSACEPHFNLNARYDG